MYKLATSSDFELHRERNGLWHGTFTAMANPCEVLCEVSDGSLARHITALAAGEARRIEQKFSRYRTDNIVHAINTSSGQPIDVDPETARLIEFGAALWGLSDGAFDLTSGVLRRVWKFSGDVHPPEPSAVDKLREIIGWDRVSWAAPRLRLPSSMELDFGGIGKEYAVDRVVELIQAEDDHPVLVNFGGDLRCCDRVPSAGSWQVGIESVAHHGQAVHRIRLTAGALATSGNTRRFIEQNGRRYGHILDARTGWPTPDAARSITVAAPTCSQAGTYSTLAMLRGAEAEQFLRDEGLKFWCLR